MSRVRIDTKKERSFTGTVNLLVNGGWAGGFLLRRLGDSHTFKARFTTGRLFMEAKVCTRVTKPDQC